MIGAPAPGATALLDTPSPYRFVDQAVPNVPWVAIHGATTVARGTPIAIVVNGVVAGFSTSYRAPTARQDEFWGTLVPQLFHDGRNVVHVYAIDGTPGAPTLHLVAPEP